MISIPLFFDSRKGQGKSEDFTTSFDPPLQLDVSKNYEIALISSQIWYAWHNITDQNFATDFFTHAMVQLQNNYEYHQVVMTLKT